MGWSFHRKLLLKLLTVQPEKSDYKVALLDIGVKRNIVQCLVDRVVM